MIAGAASAMADKIGPGMIAIVGCIVIVGIVALEVGRKDHTAGTLSTIGGALGAVAGVVATPVTGGMSNVFGAAIGSATGAMVGSYFE